MLCPFVKIISRRIIAFKLVEKYKFVVFIFDRMLWLYSGNKEAKRSYRLIKSFDFGLINLLKSYDPFQYHNKECETTLGALASTV